MHLPWREVAPGAGPAIPTSVTEAETTRMRDLASVGRGSALEIGAAYGYSTVVLAQEIEDVVSIDPHITHGSYGVLMANLVAYGVADRVEVRKQFSRDVLPGMVVSESYDLIFIDGDHTAAGVEFDLTCAFELIRPGGVILAHDVEESCCCPDVGPTVRRMLADHPTGELVEIVDTMAVILA